MANLYANENFPLQVVIALRDLGHDVVTVRETGKDEQRFPDDEVLRFAHSMQRAVVTLNRKHFIRLHLEQPDHSGIIVCTFDRRFIDQAQRIHNAILAENALAGRLLRVNRPM